MNECEGTFEDNRHIRAAIHDKVTNPCPGCGKRVFTFLDGYLNLPIYEQLGASTDKYVPTVVRLCINCGFMSPHALSVLLNS